MIHPRVCTSSIAMFGQRRKRAPSFWYMAFALTMLHFLPRRYPPGIQTPAFNCPTCLASRWKSHHKFATGAQLKLAGASLTSCGKRRYDAKVGVPHVDSGMSTSARAPEELSPDDALTRTYGNGNYQRLVFAIVGVCIHSFVFPFQLMSVFTDIKMVADAGLNGFSLESLSFASSILFLGWLVGSVLMGPLTDKWGRRPVVFGGGAITFLGGVGTLLAPSLGSTFDYQLFLLAKLVMGIGVASAAVAVVYVQECIPGQFRGRSMAVMNGIYSLGAALQAYFCGSVTMTWDWRTECLLWYAPTLIGITLGIPLLGESLLFLVSSGRDTEANNTLGQIAATNGSAASAKGIVLKPQKIEASPSGSDHDEESLLSAQLLPRVLALMFCFAASAMSYYGLSYSAGALSANLYQNSVLLNLVDIIGYGIVLGVDKFGRRMTQGICFLLAGLCLLLCGVLKASTWPVVVCALIGRLFVSACFTIIYILVVELFPTSCRSAALGLCCVAARVGGLFGPMARNFPVSVSCPIFGILCAVASFLSFRLPETAGKRLS